MRFWTRIEKKRRKYIAKYYRLIRADLREMVGPVKDYLKINPNIEALLGQVEYMINPSELKETIIRLYGDVGKDFATHVRDQVVRRKGMEEDIWEENLMNYASRIAGRKIVSIRNYTKVQIESMIRETMTYGLEEGLGTEEISRLFMSRFEREWTEQTQWRAMRIAQTEVIGASNRASYESASTSGYPMKKIWLTAPLGVAKTERHALEGAIQNKEIMMDEKFVVNGVEMDCPGDDAGGPAETINCFTPDQATRMNKKYIKKLFRAPYNGKIITIKMTNGNSFTCTPHHPIFSRNGWIMAKEINTDTKLIKSSFIEASLSDFKVDNIPVTLEKHYDAFHKIGMSMRVSGINVNFYGDIPDGDVDIVSTKSLLRNRIIVKLFKVFNNISFKLAYFFKTYFFGYRLLDRRFMMKSMREFSHSFISFLNNLAFFIQTGILKSYKICFASISNREFIFSDNSFNSISTNIKLFGHTKDTSPGRIQINDGLFIDFNSCRSEDMIGIAKISTHDYKGYVYTMETKHQMYEISGIIAKNCRCAIAYEVL